MDYKIDSQMPTYWAFMLGKCKSKWVVQHGTRCLALFTLATSQVSNSYKSVIYTYLFFLWLMTLWPQVHVDQTNHMHDVNVIACYNLTRHRDHRGGSFLYACKPSGLVRFLSHWVMIKVMTHDIGFHTYEATLCNTSHHISLMMFDEWWCNAGMWEIWPHGNQMRKGGMQILPSSVGWWGRLPPQDLRHLKPQPKD